MNIGDCFECEDRLGENNRLLYLGDDFFINSSGDMFHRYDLTKDFIIIEKSDFLKEFKSCSKGIFTRLRQVVESENYGCDLFKVFEKLKIANLPEFQFAVDKFDYICDIERINSVKGQISDCIALTELVEMAKPFYSDITSFIKDNYYIIDFAFESYVKTTLYYIECHPKFAKFAKFAEFINLREPRLFLFYKRLASNSKLLGGFMATEF